MSCSEEQNTQPSPGGVNNRKNQAEYRRKRTHLKQKAKKKKKEELDDTFMYSLTRLYGGGPQDIEGGTYLEGDEREEFQQNLDTVMENATAITEYPYNVFYNRACGGVLTSISGSDLDHSVTLIANVAGYLTMFKDFVTLNKKI